MLLSRENLTRHVCSKDATRLHLHNLCITREGVISSDGHRLLVTPLPETKGADFPRLHGAPDFDPASELEDGEKVLLPVTAAKKVATQLETKATLPVLKLAALDAAGARANGHVPLGVTDLETWALNTVRKPDAEFPDYEQVIPKEDRALFTIGVNADYLAELAKMVSAGGSKIVSLTFYADRPVSGLSAKEFFEQVSGKWAEEDGEPRTCGAPTNPLKIAGKNADGQEVYAILMPARLCSWRRKRRCRF
ncbi:hypothetical protein K2Z84_21495 [Candidatus Binatia bacterium]|nr:hypothetical protein [Candidatus Binatia bacterium]